ncbi:Ig-like domain-containing protein [Burkholderia ambifaria]|uniref:Ig-like domain-containing protein n=4 Tax=Burkholderia ambifaria TaxID=152480 RepID=UPI003392104D
MATTSSGIAVSISNTPQATNDVFTSAQTGLTDNSLTTVYLNVMANDLGGAAKTLYSLDSGTETTVSLEQAALLTQDTVRAESVSTDFSAHGAHIWITSDGKVGYDASHLDASWLSNSFNTLGYAQDSFTYAIRLGNGTLSWATAYVDIAPPAPVVVLAHDTGMSATDHLTSDCTLSVGAVAHGATVQYSTDNGAHWNTSFCAVEGTNTVMVRQIDVTGNASAASSCTFTLDTAGGTAPGVALAVDSGSSATDHVTNVGALNVTGVDTGATVQYSVDNGAHWSTSFSAVEGLNNVQVRQVDVAGNASAPTSFSFTLDTAAGAPGVALTSDSGGSATDHVTNVGALNLSGIETGATVQYSVDNGAHWSTSFSAVDGLNNVQVRQIDVAGNTSAPTSFSFTLDTSAAAPGVALTSDSGSSATDHVTNVGTLNVTGIETGATVQYSVDNGGHWNTSFSAVEGLNNVQVRQIDVAGNTSPPTSFSFTLDTSAAAPGVALTTDSGSNAADHITNVGALNLSGIETGATVQYSVDNGGHWSTSFSAVEGLNNVQVRQIDVAGNTSAATSFSFTLDTSAGAPGVALTTDSGSNAADHITNVGTLNLSGIETGATVQYSVDNGAHWSTSFGALEGVNNVQVRQIDVAGNTSTPTSFSFTLDTSSAAPGVALTTDSGSNPADHVTNVGTLNLSGIETGATVQYSVDNGAHWNTSFSAVEGLNNVQVRQIDVAGNTSAATSFSFTLDTSAAAPGVALTTDSGSSGTDHITNVGTLNLTGVETGATVEYSTDGGHTWNTSFNAVEGVNDVQVRQTDVAGNTSAATSLSFTLDTLAAAPGVALTSDSGSSATDHISNVGTLNVTGIETGATVQYSVDNGAHWSTSFGALEGVNNVQVRQIDVAGNTSSATSFSFTLDTSAAAPGVALTTDSGSGDTDHVTNVGTLNLTGVETGATIEYSTDGGHTWNTSFNAVEGVNDVQVRQTDVAGNTSAPTSFSFTLDTSAAAPSVALTADSGSSATDHITNVGTLNLTGVETGATVEYSTDGGHTWNTSFNAVEGANDVQVRQTDIAGNTSAATSLSFTLDTSAAAPGVALTTDSGSGSTDHITNVGTLNLSGVEAGATVEYSTDGGHTWNTSFNAVEGVNDVQIRQTDVAGNTSASTSFNFTLDTSAAAPGVALTSDSGSNSTDHITNVGTLNVSGVKTGAVVEYSIDGGHTWNTSFNAVEGVNDVQVRQTDVAGNTSAPTAFSFTLDTSAAAPSVALTADSGSSATDHITNVGTLNLTGVETGATIEYSTDGGHTWNTSFNAVEGVNDVQVRQTDVAGNTSAPTSFSFTLDTSAAAPGVALASDSGSSATDHITSAGTLNLTGVETGATVEYSIDGGHTWSTSFNAVEGANDVQVRQTDIAGNTSDPTAFNFTLDTSAAAPGVALTTDSGSSSTDHTTSAGTLNLTGVETGATVEYSTDGGHTWNTSFNAVEGVNDVQVRQTDIAGNTSDPTAFSFTLDTSAAAPGVALTTDSGSNATDHITNVGTLNLTGVETGATVEYSTDGGHTWSTSFNAVEGVNDVQIRQTDVAGNTSDPTSFSFTLDTSAAAPGVALTTDSGSSATDHTTNVGTLNLTGIETGATVEYSTDGGHTWNTGFNAVEGVNDVQVRQTDVAGNTTDPTSFSFTLDTSAAAPGVALTTDSGSNATDHITNVGTLNLTGVETGATVEYSIDGGHTWSTSFNAVEGANDVQVRQTDIAGNTSDPTAFNFTLDTSAAAPGVSLTTDSGSNVTDHITNAGTLNLTGVETGATVEYSTDDGHTWNTNFNAVEGVNDVQVRQTDIAGNTSDPTAFSFTLDTSAAAPGVALTADSGTSSTDHITNVGTLNLTGVETGATVEYSTDGGHTWNISFNAVEGLNNVQVRQTDVAGNTSDPTAFSFTLDTSAAAPGVALTADSGSNATDHITNVGTLNVSGVETGAVVEYSIDGGHTWNTSFNAVEGVNEVQVRQTDIAGNTSDPSSFSFTLDTSAAAPGVALTTDSGSGSTDHITNVGTLNLTGVETGATVEYSTDGGHTWITNFNAIEGVNDVQVRQTDIAGNTSDPTSFSFTLDTSAAAPGVALTSDSGSSAADHITNVGTLNVSGVETGAVVEYSTDGGHTWNISFNAVEGLNNVQVRQTDVAGNTSDPTAFSFTLDTSAAAPGVALTADSGSNATDHITNVGTLNVSGVETGAVVEYSTDGGHTWNTSFNAVEGVNDVQIRQTDVAGNTSSATSFSFTLDTSAAAPGVALTSDSGSSATDHTTNVGTLNLSGIETGATVEYSTDGGHTWSTSFNAVEGVNDVQVRQTDVAGNTSDPTSFSFTLDTSAAAPSVALTTDSGSSSTDHITSAGTLNLTGVETGATVEYSTDGGHTWNTSFNAVEGVNDVQVRQIDVAGNTSSATSLSFTLDTSAAAPGVALTTDSGSNVSDHITNVGTLNLTGVETGATIEYSTDGGHTWNTSFNAVEGVNDVQVRQTDVAGNTSDSTSFGFTLDTSAAAPGVALTSDSGSSATDHITNVGTLNLTAVETGASVEYSIDGGHTWNTSFNAVEGVNDVQVRQTDVAGNTSASTSFSFTLDTSAAAPGVALTGDSGSSATDHITNVGTLNLNGVETGAAVEYSTDGGHTWSTSFNAVEGVNDVQVRQTDIAGNTSDPTSFNFTLDTSAAAPGVALTADSGSNATDHITNVGTLNVSGVETGAVVEYSIDGGHTWNTSFNAVEGVNDVQVRQTDIAGNTSDPTAFSFTLDTSTAAPGVALTTDSGSNATDHITSVGTLNVSGVETGAAVEYSIDGGHTWNTSFNAVEGVNDVQVRQTDIAGNTSDPTSFSFTLDTSAAAPGVALTTDSGSNATDHITNVGTLNVSGVETGAVVEYSIDGGHTWNTSFNAVEGVNNVQVRQIDVAGNTSSATSFSFTLDTSAAAPGVALTTDSGSNVSDHITNVGTLNLTGVETGATIEYSTDGGHTWNTSFNAVEGVNDVQVRQTDIAGNTSAPTSLSFTLDTSAAAPGVALTSDSGSSATDHISNVGTLNVTGIETGATVQYSVDNGVHWNTSFSAIEGLNNVQVRQIDVAGNTSSASSLSFTLDTSATAPGVVLTTDSGSSGTDHITNVGTLNVTGTETGAIVQYSIDNGAHWNTSFSAVEGLNNVQVRQIDVAGNTSSATSFSFTLDTSAAAPGVALTTDSGTSTTDHITNVGTLNVTGTEAGATVQYSIDNGVHWNTSFSAVEGLNNVQVRQIDVAGNTSSATSLSFTLDTSAAAPGVALTTDSGSSATDHITNVGTLSLSGIENGATVQYSIDNGAHWSTSFSAVPGVNNVQVREIDIAGNTSSATSFNFTLDTSAAAPGVALTTDSGSNATDHITNVGTLNVTGTETGAIVQYSIDNGAHWNTNFSAIEGLNNVQVRQVDAAGNTSSATSFSFTLDTSAAAPGVALTADSGSSATDHITNVGTLNLSGIETGATVQYSIDNGAHWNTSFSAVQGVNNVQVREIDIAGNTSSATSFSFTLDTSAAAPGVALTTDSGTSATDHITNVGTLNLSGIETGATVQYSVDNGAHWNTSFSAVEGLNNVQVRQLDLAGNTSSATSLSFTLDTSAAAPGVALTTDSGSSTTDHITNVGTLNLSGIETGATVQYSIDNGAHWNTTFSATEGVNNLQVRQIDIAGNISNATSLSFTLDTTAPSTLSWQYNQGTHTLTANTDTSNVWKVLIHDNTTNADYTATQQTAGTWTYTTQQSLNLNKDSLTVTEWDTAGNSRSLTQTAPAGATGSEINLALTDPSGHAADLAVTIAGIPSGWTLNAGTDLGNGTWLVPTNDLGALTITPAASFTGATVLTVTETWTAADGTHAAATIADNIEAYAANAPIFAWSGDDQLTGSAGNDLFVFSQPIGNDTLHTFDLAADKIDLVGFTGIANFSDVQAHLADDANGNAVITLGDGATITVTGVHSADLTGDNFVFDQEPVVQNAGVMTVSDGAMLPIGGIVENTGTIALGSTGDITRFEILPKSATLEGGGHVTLSDDAHNVVFGSTPDATLVNVNNTITGAGQLGAGQLTLVNEGTIVADGANTLVIDTGTHAVANAGTLEATGSGGLVIESAVNNTGNLWANNGNLTIHGDVTGAGSATISGGATLEFGGASAENTTFADGAAGTLKLDHSAGFTGTVSGFGAGDALDLTDVLFGDHTTLSFTANDTGTGGTLTVSDGAHTAQVALQGNLSGGSFQLSHDQGSGTVVTYVPPPLPHIQEV